MSATERSILFMIIYSLISFCFYMMSQHKSASYLKRVIIILFTSIPLLSITIYFIQSIEGLSKEFYYLMLSTLCMTLIIFLFIVPASLLISLRKRINSIILKVILSITSIAFVLTPIFAECVSLFIPTDEFQNLGDGYEYHKEYRMIMGPDGCIPRRVEKFKVNKEFIIARQDPQGRYPEVLEIGERNWHYPSGPDSIYFWIIDKKKDVWYGPTDSFRFTAICDSLKIDLSL